MKNRFPSTVAGTAAVLLVAMPLQAYGEVAQGQGDVKPTFNVRYRLESVDQEGINEAALASTARVRLSWMMPSSDGLSAGIEGDYVARIGPEKYNSTNNGRTGFPVVADPTGFDLNQAYVRYRRDSLTVTMGRQRILHAGQRFVGGVAWRQNEQTYDSLRVQSTHERASVDYSYVANVNRIFGPDDGAQPADWEGASHLARGEIKLAEGHALRRLPLCHGLHEWQRATELQPDLRGRLYGYPWGLRSVRCYRPAIGLGRPTGDVRGRLLCR